MLPHISRNFAGNRPPKACHLTLSLRYYGDAHIRDTLVETVANDIDIT